MTCTPCGNKRCSLCNIILRISSLCSQAIGKVFHLKAKGGSCNSTFCIYCIICPSCNLQYVGSSVKLRARLNQHKSSLRSFSRPGTKQRNDCWRLYEHLSIHSPNEFKFTILEVLDSEYGLRDKETSWIWRLDTVFPKGLNINDGFNAQVRKSRVNSRYPLYY